MTGVDAAKSLWVRFHFRFMLICFLMKSFLLLLFLLPCIANARTVQSDHVDVRVISKSPIQSKKNLQLAVHYKMEKHWHIYWKNSGDSGAAPKFKVEGGTIENIQWPYPERINVADLVNYGYNNETAIYLDVHLTQPKARLDLEWLVCKVDCVPGFASFEVGADEIINDPDVYRSFLKDIPSQDHELSTEILASAKNQYSFKVNDPSQKGLVGAKNLYVFPWDGNKFLTRAAKIKPEPHSYDVSLETSPNEAPGRETNHFTLVSHFNDGRVLSFDIEVAADVDQIQILLALFFAFIGGLILNIMPCVFPVLFLKGYSFLKSESTRAVRQSSWIYSLGVLFSFFVIGALILGLRAAGASIGWGFQLQSPILVSLLALLFFIMALGFLDILSFDRWIPSGLQNLGSKKYFSGDFGTGVLAVVVASPCTAPFMGTALGLTLLLPPLVSLLIFVSLGAGLAAPVVLLAHIPGLVQKMPRSGSWMIRVKKWMALPLMGTCIWLVWVLIQQVTVSENQASKAWASYNKPLVESHIKEGPVFIDFTAAWCITCQVNKKRVLDTVEIQELFKKNQVYLVRADWTNYSPEVTQALAEFQRNSVPLYVYYSQGKNSAVILSELLEKEDIYKLFPSGGEQ